VTRTILLATRDPDEQAELRRLVGGFATCAIPAGSDGQAFDHGGTNHRDQAVNRARAWSERAGTSALAVATALQVYALDQGPGLRTHDYAGAAATPAEHRAKLLATMARVAPGQRIALFQATAAYAAPGAAKVIAASATLECEITTAERGTAGCLFDAIIQVQDRRTLAEMPDDDRDRLGHRGMAVRQLIRRLEREGPPA
jgi:non-canonical purine NTP pyrophosphatase (RdgB/HAM1 family)